MNEEEIQKHLTYITKIHAPDILSSKLRGVSAIWECNTAHLIFYTNEALNEEEREQASIIGTEIAAHMPRGMINEKFVIIPTIEINDLGMIGFDSIDEKN